MSQITPVILCGGSGIRPGKAAFAAVLGESIGYAPWPVATWHLGKEDGGLG
jgi:hypothetical protein